MILIIANGILPPKDFCKQFTNKADKIIAADGGANHCLTLGITPDIVIGDLDSISDEAKEKFNNILEAVCHLQ